MGHSPGAMLAPKGLLNTHSENSFFPCCTDKKRWMNEALSRLFCSVSGRLELLVRTGERGKGFTESHKHPCQGPIAAGIPGSAASRARGPPCAPGFAQERIQSQASRV